MAARGIGANQAIKRIQPHGIGASRRQAGLTPAREFFAFRCDNHVTGWQMALAGMGIAFAPRRVAARWPEMRAVLDQIAIPAIPLWLTAHRELRQSARIRCVFDALHQGLQGLVEGGAALAATEPGVDPPV